MVANDISKGSKVHSEKVAQIFEDSKQILMQHMKKLQDSCPFLPFPLKPIFLFDKNSFNSMTFNIMTSTVRPIVFGSVSIVTASPNGFSSSASPENIPILSLSAGFDTTVDPRSLADTCTVHQQNTKFAYKAEDVRKDQAIMAVIRLMSKILRDNGVELPIVTYNVLPTGLGAGLLEFVQDAKTIADIFQTAKNDAAGRLVLRI